MVLEQDGRRPFRHRPLALRGQCVREHGLFVDKLGNGDSCYNLATFRFIIDNLQIEVFRWYR